MVDNPFAKPEESLGPSWVTLTVVPAAFAPPVAPVVSTVAPVAPTQGPETVVVVKIDEKAIELKAKKDECLARIGEILLEHNNLESNIHPRHEYWSLLHQYRAM